MSSYRSLIVVAMLSVGAAAPATAQLVNDGGFQGPGVSGYIYNPTTSFWTFKGGAGLINGFTTAWNTPVSSATGGQFAFLQANTRREWGSIWTTITLPTTGLYNFSFLNASRGPGCCGGNTIFDVLLGTTQIGQFTTQTGDEWTEKGGTFLANAGTYTLKFTTDTKLPGDNTTFIDNVSVSVVATPEPASASLLATGLFAIVGFAARRKRNA